MLQLSLSCIGHPDLSLLTEEGGDRQASNMIYWSTLVLLDWTMIQAEWPRQGYRGQTNTPFGE